MPIYRAFFFFSEVNVSGDQFLYRLLVVFFFFLNFTNFTLILKTFSTYVRQNVVKRGDIFVVSRRQATGFIGQRAQNDL